MHKRTIIVSALSLGIAGALSATAYVSSAGSGSATVNAKILPLEVTVTPVSPDLTFGDSQVITISVKNDNKGIVHITHATFSLSGVPAGCPAGSFTLTPSSVNAPPPGFPIGAGAIGPVGTTTLAFVDLGSDQTACAPSALSVKADVS